VARPRTQPATGPGSEPAWHSPLRGPWLTSVFGAVLLKALPVVIITALLDYIAYGPRFGQAIPADVGWLRLPQFDWPTRPSWLFQLTEGLHVVLGLVIIPVVLAKLWSVVPKLFAWPPARSVAQVLERLSLLLLVGGILFEIATGVLNIQYDYLFGFSFYAAHYYGAWVFIAGFVVHVALKLPHMIAGLRSRSMRAELRSPLAQTRPEPPDTYGLVAARCAALLLPRGRSYGDGPNDFQVNRTAGAAGITPAATGAGWALTLGGPRPTSLIRAMLLAMPQHTATLPIACVEGWATTQTWTGVRLADLAAAAEVPAPGSAMVASLEEAGAFNKATLAANQVLDPDSLLALAVNGAELSADHGYPARITVPAMPGVHNTKWVRSIDFRSA